MDGDRIASGAGELTIARAMPDDVDVIVRLNDDAAAWVRARGYDPGEPPIPLGEIVARRVARGEAYLARLGGMPDGTPVGTLTLQWADALVWGADDTGDALYVHGLMVSRMHEGQGIGLALLDWAGLVAAGAGKTWLRLDCRADNPSLRGYYERAGFTYRGDVRLLNYHGARYERRTNAESGAPSVRRTPLQQPVGEDRAPDGQTREDDTEGA